MTVDLVVLVAARDVRVLPEADVPLFRVSRAGLAPRAEAVAAQFRDAADAEGYATGHEGWGPSARYFHSRLYAVQQTLRSCPGGDLLDVGCGPGMLVRHLLDTRPGDFRITASDQSPVMLEAVAARSRGVGDVELVVSGIEDMPFSDESFDVVLAMGVLEYTDAASALRELARVVRPGGLVVVTMLNPTSPYRLFEWCIYWPALRVLGRIQGLLGTPVERRYGARHSGIRAVSQSYLRRMLHDVGLCPREAVYYDLTSLVPPFDKLVRRRSRDWRAHPEKTVGSGVRRWLGTAYLVSAHRPTVGL